MVQIPWLWLWSRPEATAPIGPLACEPPYAAGAALKDKEKKIRFGFRKSETNSVAQML